MGFSCNKPKTISVTQATAVSLIGNTQTQTQSLSWNSTSWQLQKYSKSFTSNTVNVNYGLSARLYIGGSYRGALWYIANQTTGTWVATGYAP